MRFSVEGVLNVLKAMLEAMPTTMLLSVSVLIISHCNCYGDGIL